MSAAARCWMSSSLSWGLVTASRLVGGAGGSCHPELAAFGEAALIGEHLRGDPSFEQLDGHPVLSPPSLWRGLGYRHVTPLLIFTRFGWLYSRDKVLDCPCRPARLSVGTPAPVPSALAPPGRCRSPG